MGLDKNLIGFGRDKLAPWACDAGDSRGRLFEEEASPTRSPFQRDRDRIIHTTAFRRLKHKTQVFVAHEGDHYRTRLTHTIEVAQIARALARALKLDEDLAEAVALVHDFGHTPFGHTGEEVLDRLLHRHGGFDHNAQSLRIVTELEQRYAQFDGLNLTWETLEGLVKHNGPLLDPSGNHQYPPVPKPIDDYNARHDLHLSEFAGLEAQVAAISDDIAYNTHDIDDGLRSGLITLEILEEVPFLDQLLRTVRSLYPDLEESRVIHEIMRRQITAMVEDVIATTQANLKELQPECADDVRRAGRVTGCFSERMADADKAIKRFLYANMYRHPTVMRVRKLAADVLEDLYGAYLASPDLMGGQWSAGVGDLDAAGLERRVADYLAGMTDNFALSQHRSLFDQTPELL